MYRILILADVPGWAYDRRMLTLARHAPEDFSVTTSYYKDIAQGIAKRGFDLIFMLDFTARSPLIRTLRDAKKQPLVVYSWNCQSASRVDLRKRLFREELGKGFIIINNLEGFEGIKRTQGICNISNGVDGDLFYLEKPMKDRTKVLAWYGSGNKSKPSRKGYQDFLVPLKELLEGEGWEVRYRVWFTPLQTWPEGEVWDADKLRGWYNDAAVVVCASQYEGTPNFLLEGMACGCAIATTRCGNALEFGKQGENLVFCDRTVDALAAGVRKAWEKREQLSEKGIETMAGWNYGPPGNRAEYFYQLFRRLIDGGVSTVKPFTYATIPPTGI